MEFKSIVNLRDRIIQRQLPFRSFNLPSHFRNILSINNVTVKEKIFRITQLFCSRNASKNVQILS